jgi:hypothetical protein
VFQNRFVAVLIESIYIELSKENIANGVAAGGISAVVKKSFKTMEV